MTSRNIKALKNVAPKFVTDQDEYWMTYLPQNELTALRRERTNYLAEIEELEALERELHRGGADTKPIEKEVLEIKTTVNQQIARLLELIPRLKKKALDKRDDLIRQDLELNEPNTSATPLISQSIDTGEENVNDDDDDDGMEAEFMNVGFMPAFIPRAANPPRTQPAAKTNPRVEPKRPNARPEQQQSLPKTPVRDKFYDDVCDDDKPILMKLRPIIDKYDCKSRVVETLARLRKRGQRKIGMDSLKKYIASQRRQLVPSNGR